MAKTLTSAIGVDLGRYSLKSVLLQKKGGNRYVVTHFASLPVTEAVERTPGMLGSEIKALVKQMGGSAKGCAVAVSSPGALMRIIEQPETPPEILRDALRLNGTALMNQDCKNFVLDCVDCDVPAAGAAQSAAGAHSSAALRRYLVAGLPRTEVAQLTESFALGGLGNVSNLHLAPLVVFNAFEFAQPDVFNNQAFFLIDFGHMSSTMMIGARRELSLIRTVEFGGKSFVEALCALSGESSETVLTALGNDDEVMIEYARMALMALTREIGSSIGFFEGRREETISNIWVSGGLARNATLLRLLGEELRMPCQPWVALERCELNVSTSKRAQLAEEMLDYSIACGAAAQLLNA
ncbi:MAG: pilus assembly protein PilM [Verrucomicrobia bacterium]|nr:pilus assembly protein PilM [Verrucomicrobiota bacterium]